ncbi:hypothetical protein [Dyadobacter sp. CY323]|uniref:TapB family protein n=1 Tax=Dyadobacter sp. CY323 TaxID=2907302 RepID=UPI001F20D870|nr:hypothetical protein [Dyadobacter sp. CY323]MCE6988245.1 hypothetical protein [Dyadobacter sp. CY323]
MKNKTQFSSFRQARNVLFACAIAALAFTSCKDDEKVVPDDVVQAKKAIIPENGKQYSYKIVDSDGTVETSVTKVKSVKDSAGFSVFNIQNIVKVEDGQYPVDYKAYSNNGATTYELEMPAVFAAIIKELRPLAYMEDIDVTGFPQYQIFDNKGTVDSPVTFKGAPINLKIKMLIIVEGGDNVEAEVTSRITYKSGKVVKEEAVTTPAGTFNCSKWQYSYVVVTRFAADGYEPEEDTQAVNVSLWTAPEIGIVKSLEESADGESSLTELQKIQ